MFDFILGFLAKGWVCLSCGYSWHALTAFTCPGCKSTDITEAD